MNCVKKCACIVLISLLFILFFGMTDIGYSGLGDNKTAYYYKAYIPTGDESGRNNLSDYNNALAAMHFAGATFQGVSFNRMTEEFSWMKI